MAIYDVAILGDPKDTIVTAFKDSFYTALRSKGITASLFDTVRSALVYKPLLMLDVSTSQDIDPSKHGFLVECQASSELVSIIIQSLEKQGLTNSTELGYVLSSTTNVDYIYIKLNLGYTTSAIDSKYLTQSAIKDIATKLFADMQEPAKYIKIYNDKILTVDPDMDLGLYNEVPESKQVGCSGKFIKSTYNNKPLTLLHIEKTSIPSSIKYRWETHYRTTEPETKHVLIFSAKLAPGSSTGVPLQILVGSTCVEYLVQSHELMTFKVDFVPKRIEAYNTHLPFSVDVAILRPDDVPFSVNVKQWRYPVTEELPFSFEVAANYNILFGISNPGAIEITGVQVCKRGVLDILDDPIQRYTPYPNIYDPFKAVDMQLNSSSKLANQLTTSNASFLTKATVKPLNLLDIANLPGVSKISQAENAIKSFTDSFTDIMSSVNSLVSGSSPFINIKKLNINFGPLESALNDPTLDFNKKKYMQQMVNSMKVLQRSQAHALDTSATMVQQVTKVEKQVQGIMHDTLVKMGTGFQDATKQVDKLQKSIQSQVAQASSAASGITNIPKNTLLSNPLASMGSLSSKVTSAIPKNIALPYGGGTPFIPDNLKKATGKSQAFVNPLDNLGKEAISILSPILKTGKDIEAEIKSAQSKIGSILGSINPGLGTPIVGGRTSQNSKGVQVPGIDYSRYWKP